MNTLQILCIIIVPIISLIIFFSLKYRKKSNTIQITENDLVQMQFQSGAEASSDKRLIGIDTQGRRVIIEKPPLKELPQTGRLIKTKYTKSLKKDHKVLAALLIFSIIAIGVSFLLEYKIIVISHSQYYCNVALGISGSAIISFVVMCLPFRDKRKEQIDSIGNSLKQSLFMYRHGVLEHLSLPMSTDEAETVLKYAQSVERHINIALYKYYDSEFISKPICGILEYCNTNLLRSIYYCQAFCITLIEQNKNNIQFREDKLKEYTNWIKQEMMKACEPQHLDDLLQIFSNVKLYFEFDLSHAHLFAHDHENDKRKDAIYQEVKSKITT